MNVQIIRKNGQPEWAVIPFDEYLRLIEEAELLEDIQDYDAAKKSIEAGEELVPGSVTYAILDGAHPVKVWREHRGLTTQQLATAAQISESNLLKIESGELEPATEILAAIANALNLSLEDLTN